MYCPNHADTFSELVCGIPIGVSERTKEKDGKCPLCEQCLYDDSGKPFEADYQLEDGPAHENMFTNTEFAQLIYDHHDQSLADLSSVSQDSPDWEVTSIQSAESARTAYHRNPDNFQLIAEDGGQFPVNVVQMRDAQVLNRFGAPYSGE